MAKALSDVINRAIGKHQINMQVILESVVAKLGVGYVGAHLDRYFTPEETVSLEILVSISVQDEEVQLYLSKAVPFLDETTRKLLKIIQEKVNDARLSSPEAGNTRAHIQQLGFPVREEVVIIRRKREVIQVQTSKEEQPQAIPSKYDFSPEDLVLLDNFAKGKFNFKPKR